MIKKNHTINAYFVSAALFGAKRKGYDIDSLMFEAGIDPVTVSAAGSRVSPDSMTELIRSIWSVLDDEFMGFTHSQCKQGVFAIMSKQAVACNTLREVLVCGAHFYQTIRSDIQFSFEENEHEAILSFGLDGAENDPDNFLVEFFLLIWHRFSSWLVGHRVPLKYVSFIYASPDHVSEYSLLFPCHCRFNQSANSIFFDKSAMSLPVKQHEKALSVFLKNSPADLLSKPVFYSTFTTQVMNLIGSDTVEKFPSIEQMAARFYMSSRNLRRRLKGEGTCYQAIKDKLRYEKAISLLRDDDLTISQIARAVGYNEPAAFTRAFKGWNGNCPRYFREHSVI